MTQSVLRDATETMLQESIPGNADLDTKVRRLLETEYLHRIASYRRTDAALRRKYGMTFDQFIANRVTQRMDYSWEVETDAMEWEIAIDGFETTGRRLTELRATFNA
ncbi:MAG: hypothetical protein IAE85_16525 [Anaerolinea sp.]|nr:hypothetical protein [Anaerolinea sp.]